MLATIGTVGKGEYEHARLEVARLFGGRAVWTNGDQRISISVTSVGFVVIAAVPCNESVHSFDE